MAEQTKIQWCDHTFNPWEGCQKVHEGCTNCYAEARANHWQTVTWGPNGTRRRASDNAWKQPLKWDREAKAAGERRRVFCASLADVFEDWQGMIVNSDGTELCRCHECGEVMFYDQRECSKDCHSDRAPRKLTMNDMRADLFALIDRTPNLDWLLLTKRPENIRRMWPQYGPLKSNDISRLGKPLYRENCWLGTSVSNQSTAAKQIPELVEVRDLAPVLFVSAEPLLGPIDFDFACVRREISCLDWIIVGGESGHGSRPCNIAWIRSIRDQCQAAGIACFVKQLGRCATTSPQEASWSVGNHHSLGLIDRKGGDMDEWPEDFRVREFPQPV